MTRKDYEKFAAAFKEARRRVDERLAVDNTGVNVTFRDVRYGIALVEQEVRRVFAADNPRFDDDRFRQASGAFDKQ